MMTDRETLLQVCSILNEAKDESFAFLAKHHLDLQGVEDSKSLEVLAVASNIYVLACNKLHAAIPNPLGPEQPVLDDKTKARLAHLETIEQAQQEYHDACERFPEDSTKGEVTKAVEKVQGLLNQSLLEKARQNNG